MITRNISSMLCIALTTLTPKCAASKSGTLTFWKLHGLSRTVQGFILPLPLLLELQWKTVLPFVKFRAKLYHYRSHTWSVPPSPPLPASYDSQFNVPEHTTVILQCTENVPPNRSFTHSFHTLSCDNSTNSPKSKFWLCIHHAPCSTSQKLSLTAGK